METPVAHAINIRNRDSTIANNIILNDVKEKINLDNKVLRISTVSAYGAVNLM